jgi:hypothetical protein
MVRRASGVQVGEVLPCHREHAASTGGRVIDGAHHPRLGQHFVILNEQQVDHQADDLTRGKVLPGGFVGDLSKLADQLLEHQSHLTVADDLRVQVNRGELLCYQIKQVALVQAFHLGMEVKALEDVPHGGGEALDVTEQVVADVILIPHQLFHVQRGDVVETLASLAQ